jgi:hypothetical protein
MWSESQVFHIIEERYNEVTLKNNVRWISPIKIDVLMNSVDNTFHYVDMTGDMAFLFSEVLSLRLCKSTERVWNTLLFKEPH